MTLIVSWFVDSMAILRKRLTIMVQVYYQVRIPMSFILQLIDPYSPELVRMYTRGYQAVSLGRLEQGRMKVWLGELNPLPLTLSPR